ncbi:family 78 glycoside hydrolase catalytic domain [Neobacillus cucumis]|uniref:family 78 glycoside hydrolase catalytic domain n=1 Tax=Neobacillus cucumis TaxID=1740721 RepID=UPI0028535117|nr:family 78 glycoside hydrolase catalytic domain [Neobacillus cucumis]MDR4946131.1 family 78 glycoside hydrolase catalytic domain [Neobacillus cucumis]
MTILQVTNLTCEYRTNPLGIDLNQPRLSWRIESDRRGTLQHSYKIQVSLTEGFENPLWDTGVIESDQSLHIEYDGPSLVSRTRYYYRIKVWDNFGRESNWCDISWWETALLDSSEWKASWITPNPEEIHPQAEPTFMLRKQFELKKQIESARIYATGVGLYELYLNGNKVGDELLAPGWTSYHKRIQYQTYDVTADLNINNNVIGVMLADGWYKGNLAWENKRHIYGEQRAVMLQLHVRYDDGTEDVITSDPTWKTSTGPILYSEIYHGETYDARLEQVGWSEENFDDKAWKGVVICQPPVTRIVAQENNPVRVTETIRPISSFVTPEGDRVIDFGQNMVGRIRFTVNAPEGTEIVLKHAEVLDKNGNIYFGNLRTAKQTVKYIAKGTGTEIYAPYFTFQGFRYAKVEGYPGQENGLPLENFVGEVIHSDMELTGEFETSNSMVNQLQQNIVWGQRGNFVDVPTDCPQRDERLGWTGDAQVFIRTALFNYHGGQFFTKWVRDLKADQLPDGGVPFVIPQVVDGASSAAWGDAAVICPWNVYLNYGDERLLAEQYDSMKAWVEYIRVQGENEYLWNTGFHFGDWLGLDGKEDSYYGATPNDLVATAFYAYSTRLLRDSAAVLSKAEDVQAYGELLENIIQEFKNEFVTKNGRLAVSTQTAHVVALMFDLVEGKVRERIAHDLNELVLDHDYHLTTGFVGTPYLCFVLSITGYHETAVKLLLQKTYPSWLYSVTKGATTIWEHWDGIKPDGSFWSDDMNSYNHYAYGAIGDWMYRVLAGLDMDEAKPAYKRIRIQPKFGGKELTFIRASHYSMYGKITSSWNLSNEEVTAELEIPANTTAQILLPNAKLEDVKESNKALVDMDSIIDIYQTEDGVSLEIGSGSYCFVYPNEKGIGLVYTPDTKVIDILADEKTAKVLVSYIPKIGSNTSILASLKKLKLGELVDQPLTNLSFEQMEEVIEKLNQFERETVALKQ